MKQILILNLKILAAHLVACGLGILSIIIIAGSANIYIPYIAFSITIPAIYILAGFWGNNGRLKGKKPIISMFWLSIVLSALMLYFVLSGVNIKNMTPLQVFAIFANIPFFRLFFFDHNSWVILILAFSAPLWPSSLALLGFWLRSVWRKRKTKDNETID